MPWRVTIDVDTGQKLDELRDILRNIGYSKITAHDIQQQSKPEIKPTPIPVKPWTPPPPIIKRDENPYSQYHKAKNYFKNNTNRVISNEEIQKFSNEIKQPFNSIMTTISRLAREGYVEHMGRGMGYIRREPSH
jgi:hypothetical protein